MKIGVLGTGMVGQAIAGRLVEIGHTVMIGSRTSKNERAAAWVDPDAKSVAARILGDLGWKQENIIDLGDITTARGTEMLLPIWLRLAGALGHTKFNFHIVREDKNK